MLKPINGNRKTERHRDWIGQFHYHFELEQLLQCSMFTKIQRPLPTGNRSKQMKMQFAF